MLQQICFLQNRITLSNIFRIMGEVLEAWCARGESLRLRGAPVGVTQLSSALEQARLTYHAQTIKDMNGGQEGQSEIILQYSYNFIY